MSVQKIVTTQPAQVVEETTVVETQPTVVKQPVVQPVVQQPVVQPVVQQPVVQHQVVHTNTDVVEEESLGSEIDRLAG